MDFCYYIEGRNDYVRALSAKDWDANWLNWMDEMVRRNPDVIFFYTKPSTDID